MRAFVAADIAATRRMARLLEALRSSPARLRVVSPDNLHITLKFLGEAEDGLVSFIREVLTQAVEGVEPFTLTLRGSGAFPNLRSPRVLWIGVEGGDPLVRIARRLERGLEELGFARERRRYSPHLTVGRMKSREHVEDLARLMGTYREAAFGTQRVEDIRLKRSELRPTGAIYEDVFRVPLG